MRLMVPGPHDVLALVDRGRDSLEQLLGAVPRVLALLDEAESLVRRAGGLVDTIEATGAKADVVVQRTDDISSRVEDLLTQMQPLEQRLAGLLDRMEPPLTRLQPTIERLADTTAPNEVDAMIELINRLPALAHKMEVDIVPVLDSLSTVAPDLHDLLDASRELNEMLTQIPGISRMMRRIDKHQHEEGRG